MCNVSIFVRIGVFFDLGLGFSSSVGGLIIKTRWVVEVLNDSLKNII